MSPAGGKDKCKVNFKRQAVHRNVFDHSGYWTIYQGFPFSDGTLYITCSNARKVAGETSSFVYSFEKHTLQSFYRNWYYVTPINV